MHQSQIHVIPGKMRSQDGRRVMEARIRKAIRILLFNIRSRWAGEIEAALHAIQKGNVGISILQEKNLMEGIYT